jgi:hypothetical protein
MPDLAGRLLLGSNAHAFAFEFLRRSLVRFRFGCGFRTARELGLGRAGFHDGLQTRRALVRFRSAAACAHRNQSRSLALGGRLRRPGLAAGEQRWKVESHIAFQSGTCRRGAFGRGCIASLQRRDRRALRAAVSAPQNRNDEITRTHCSKTLLFVRITADLPRSSSRFVPSRLLRWLQVPT